MQQPEQLKNAGLKSTAPRLKILSLFKSGTERHMSAEEVYKNLLASDEDIGLATVYRVLTQFEQSGLLVRHYFEGGKSVFELNEGTHHDHIVCMQCGHVEEFFDPDIEAHQEQIARQHGFQIRDHALYIYADCTKIACPNQILPVKS